MASVELVELIIDSSGSMSSHAFQGMSRFQAALKVTAELIDRLKKSTKADDFFVSVIGFSAGNEAALYPPFDVNPYMPVTNIDVNDYLNKLNNHLPNVSAAHSRYGRSGRTSFDSGLAKAYEVAEKFINDIIAEVDTVYITPIMLTDGCHNTCTFGGGGRDCVYQQADKLRSLKKMASEGEDIRVRITSIIVGDKGCLVEVCKMCDEMDNVLYNRIKKHLTTAIVNPNCPDRLSFIISDRSRESLELIRNLLEIVSTTLSGGE